jgi:hypothetical protein
MKLATGNAGQQSVAAQDKAGNSSATTSCSYLVEYRIVGLIPLPNTKAGKTIPVRGALVNANLLPIPKRRGRGPGRRRSGDVPRQRRAEPGAAVHDV